MSVAASGIRRRAISVSEDSERREVADFAAISPTMRDLFKPLYRQPTFVALIEAYPDNFTAPATFTVLFAIPQVMSRGV
ncbi:hypothetical protein [Caballeronia terrestris]|uniref:hypothetical protein n=1 Tax=Caballeronia terrestris TaxID=1226301 RepID=UPI000F736EE8|nr:hypothetical protein [Caballeronia terrestris]